MVETSKKCSLEQADKLGCSDLRTDSGKCYYQRGITCENYGMKEIFWYKSINDIPRNTFSLIVAQEFFDALPVHKFRASINYLIFKFIAVIIYLISYLEN